MKPACGSNITTQYTGLVNPPCDSRPKWKGLWGQHQVVLRESVCFLVVLLFSRGAVPSLGTLQQWGEWWGCLVALGIPRKQQLLRGGCFSPGLIKRPAQLYTIINRPWICTVHIRLYNHRNLLEHGLHRRRWKSNI